MAGQERAARCQAIQRAGALVVAAGRIREAACSSRRRYAWIRISPESHNNLGHVLQLQGDTAEAILHFREAVRVRPTSDLVHLNLANALQESGEVEEAIAQFRIAIEINPDGRRPQQPRGRARIARTARRGGGSLPTGARDPAGLRRRASQPHAAPRAAEDGAPLNLVLGPWFLVLGRWTEDQERIAKLHDELFTTVDTEAEAVSSVVKPHNSELKHDVVTSSELGQKHAARRTRSTARETSARVPSATCGNSVSCRGLRPSASVSRLRARRAARRFAAAACFRPFTSRISDKVGLTTKD